MAISFFSRDKSSGEDTEGGPKTLFAVVRTMEDDLEDIRHGKKQMPSFEIKPSAAQNSAQGQSAFRRAVNPFSEEGKKILQEQVIASEGRPVAEVGSVPRPMNSFAPNTPGQLPLKIGPSRAAASSGAVHFKRSAENQKILWIGSSVILVLILGGMLYFFLQRNKAEITAEVPLPEIVPNVPAEVVVAVPQTLPFALDKPNYLSFNTETVSPDEIKKILSQAAARIEEAKMIQPIEFLVTDQNNNPLAFNRFVFLFKLNLDPDVLAFVNEPFSLYAYNDTGHTRFGLALTLKDVSMATLAIAKAETTLPYGFQSFMLEPNISVVKNIPFRSSTYKQFPVRFANVNEGQNISLDYTFDETSWLIGTSKNTLRMILDTYAK